MKVTLETSLFDDPDGVTNQELIAVFRLGALGRHRVFVENIDSEAFLTWKKEQGRSQETINLAIKNASLRETRRVFGLQIRVGVQEHSDWERPTPHLTVKDAMGLLNRPFEIWLENALNDRVFLQAVSRREERDFLKRYETEGWLKYENGGGLSNLKTNLQERQDESFLKGRMFVVFDSDALRPGCPSEVSESVNEWCHPHDIGHQLKRRFAESYLPNEAIRDWVKKKPELQPVFDAYKRLEPLQKHHFNLKKGFRGDVRRIKNAQKKGLNDGPGDLYSNLSDERKKQLAEGFGAELRERFKERIDEVQLRRDGSWDEMNGVIRKLIARIG